MVMSLFLAGCATLNKNECQTVDWEQLGLQNGQSGEPQSYIAEHQKACSQYKLPVDTMKWMRAGKRASATIARLRTA